MEKIKWGIIGPGSIANNFADGLTSSYSGQLVGIASKNDERRKSFGDKYNVHEDFRYVDLKKGNKFRLEFINFTGIHLIPTLQVNVSLLPIYFLFTSNNLDSISYLLLFASSFSIFAVIIETVADEQMREFRKDKLNKGKTMNKGLWRLSRHPNYFGEVMFWVGLYLMAILTVETPLWLMVSPVSMIMLFVFISCPMMDNRSLNNRDDYKDYMDTTPQLFLWFPKK